MKQDYLDTFEGVKSDAMYTVQYDENSDIRTTYIGMPQMRRQDELKGEQKAAITENCYTPDKRWDGSDCKIVLDMGANKSFLSKMFHLNCPSLHSLPKIVSKKQQNFQINRLEYLEEAVILYGINSADGIEEMVDG